eukprot:1657976-Amphidinium_carterae.1
MGMKAWESIGAKQPATEPKLPTASGSVRCAPYNEDAGASRDKSRPPQPHLILRGVRHNSFEG